MTAKPAPAQPAQQMSGAKRALYGYGAAIIVILILSAAAHSRLLAILGIIALAVFAVDRFRRSLRWQRAGGEKAKKQRAQFQGVASGAEIREEAVSRRGPQARPRILPDLHRSEAHVVIGTRQGRRAGPDRGHVVWCPARLRPAAVPQNGHHVVLGCRHPRRGPPVLQPPRPARPHPPRPPGPLRPQRQGVGPER